MKRRIYRHSKNLVLCFIFGIGLLLFAALARCACRIGGDDIHFLAMIRNYDLIGWVRYRYLSWSGRTVAEAYVYIFGKLPQVFWTIADVFHYGLLAFFLFRYYTLFSKNRTTYLDCTMAAASLALPFGMNFGAMCDGAFWITGSMYYLWIAAAGTAAFYPMLHYAVRKRLPHAFYCVIAVVFAFIAGSSQEQTAAVLLAFCLLFLIYIVVSERRAPFFLIGETAAALLGFLLSFTAPGNQIRFEHEIHRRIPDFRTAALHERLQYSCRWFLDAVIRHSGILLILIWGLLILLLLKKGQKNGTDYLSIIVLAIALLFMAVQKYIVQLFDFQARWGIPSFAMESSVPVAFWSFALLVTVVAAWSLYDYKLKGLALAVLILAAYASAAIMVFSPTMYESGCRTMFVPSIVLCIALLLLMSESAAGFKAYMPLIALVCLSFPVYHYLKFAQTFYTKFNYHFPW